MIMISRLIAIGSLLLLAGCGSNNEFTESEKQQVTDDVRATLTGYYNDIEAQGLLAEFGYLDDSPDFFWVPPGFTSSISYDSVSAIIRASAPRYTRVQNSFETLQIFPLSESLASYTGRLRSVMTDTTGVATAFVLVETGTVIRRPDGWKLLNGQTNLVAE